MKRPDEVDAALRGVAALLSAEDAVLATAVAALAEARASGTWGPAADALEQVLGALRDRATAHASELLEQRRRERLTRGERAAERGAP